jgi:hypothetical protein
MYREEIKINKGILMTYKRFGLFATAAALVVGMFSGVTFSPTAFAAAQTCTWTGVGGDSLFSTTANWSNCGGAAPVAGDVVSVSYDTVTDGQVLTNDLGVALGGLTLRNGSTGSSKYLWITSLQLSDGGVISRPDGYAGASLYGNIGDGTNFASITGLGDAIFQSDVAYSGIQITGKLTIGANVYYYYRGSDQFSQLILQQDSNATFDASGVNMTFDKPITLNGGLNAPLSFGAYCAVVSGYSCSQYSPTTWTVSGDITVNSMSMIDTSTNATVVFTGSVSNKALLSNGMNAHGTFQIGTSPEAVAAVTDTYAGDASTESVTVYSNHVGVVTGKRSSISVLNGGELKGTGSTQYGISVANGAIVAPGMSPGCLTAGTTLSLDGEYQFELGGTDPCTGYDQIKVLNSGNATNAVNLNNTSSILTTSRYNGYTPKQGQVFTIIDQAGSAAVNGTFKGLPEGATFEQNGVVFKISYVGGDGNDVTLTAMNSPTAPDTGFALIQTNPLLAGGIVAAMALGLVLVGRKLQGARR